MIVMSPNYRIIWSFSDLVGMNHFAPNSHVGKLNSVSKMESRT